MTQHTPGPCHVCNPAEEGRADFDGPLPYIHDETGHRIATLEGDGEPFLLCARIFAEAPEMLAFTGRALAWLTGEIDGLVDEEIESAIAQERQPTDEAIRERLASEARAILSRIDG